jgi:hypothetical protein
MQVRIWLSSWIFTWYKRETQVIWLNLVHSSDICSIISFEVHICINPNFMVHMV